MYLAGGLLVIDLEPDKKGKKEVQSNLPIPRSLETLRMTGREMVLGRSSHSLEGVCIRYLSFAPDEEEAQPSYVGVVIVQHSKDLVTRQL